MAGVAAHAVDAAAVLAAYYILKVDVAIIALQRRVAGGMAVLTARRSENAIQLQESGTRCVGVGLGRLGAGTANEATNKAGVAASARIASVRIAVGLLLRLRRDSFIFIIVMSLSRF